MSANNQTGSPEVAHWQRFDALPARFRVLLQYSNMDYNCWWVENFLSGFPEDKAYELTRRFMYTERRALILKHYGRSHPQVSR